MEKDYRKSDVEIIINTFIGLIVTKIKNGLKIKIDGLGTFSSYFKSVSVNYNKNSENTEKNVIPNVKCIQFTPSKKLKE